MAGAGETAREAIGEQKDRLVSAARDKKDELVAKVEEKAQPQSQYGEANDSERPRQLAAEANEQRPDFSTGSQQV